MEENKDQMVQDMFKQKIIEDEQKGLVAQVNILNQQFGKIKEKRNDTEFEIERFKLQINELSNKISNEPEKNDVKKVVQNPKGSNLFIKLTEICLGVPEGQKSKWDTLSFSIQSDSNPDNFFSSQNSKLNSRQNHVFSGKERCKMPVNKFSEKYNIKIYSYSQNQQVQINTDQIQIGLEDLKSIFNQSIQQYVISHQIDSQYTIKIRLEYQWVFSQDLLKQRKLGRILADKEGQIKEMNKNINILQKMMNQINAKIEKKSVKKQLGLAQAKAAPLRVVTSLKNANDLNILASPITASFKTSAQSVMGFPGQQPDKEQKNYSAIQQQQFIRKMMFNNMGGAGFVDKSQGSKMMMNPMNYAQSMINFQTSQSKESLAALQKQRRQNLPARAKQGQMVDGISKKSNLTSFSNMTCGSFMQMVNQPVANNQFIKIQKQRERLEQIENDSMLNVDVGKLQNSILDANEKPSYSTNEVLNTSNAPSQ